MRIVVVAKKKKEMMAKKNILIRIEMLCKLPQLIFNCWKMPLSMKNYLFIKPPSPSLTTSEVACGSWPGQRSICLSVNGDSAVGIEFIIKKHLSQPSSAEGVTFLKVIKRRIETRSYSFKRWANSDQCHFRIDKIPDIKSVNINKMTEEQNGF